MIPPLMPPGSFAPEDVVLLLKDLTGQVDTRDITQRELEIQAGRHYSEDLPIEQMPSSTYMAVFDRLMESQLRTVALYTGVLTRLVLAECKKPLLLSLVRAGTPCGVLMRRYASRMLNEDLPHYGISIIRGKGFDENAILAVLERHPDREPVFVDGWTGKGAIMLQLASSCVDFNRRHGTDLNPERLAVLADPAHCCSLYATREDFINPSCCLNSTVCGLISRTVHSDQLIGPADYHGVRVYHEFAGLDQTARYLDGVTAWFDRQETEVVSHVQAAARNSPPDWSGMEAVKRIGAQFAIADINRIKPSIGETTRVLLRRVPDRVLIREPNHPDCAHILLLAEEKGVPVTVYPEMPYLCCGLIADTRGRAE